MKLCREIPYFRKYRSEKTGAYLQKSGYATRNVHWDYQNLIYPSGDFRDHRIKFKISKKNPRGKRPMC